MAPRFVITVAEGRFRVLERFARPGREDPTLRDVICYDFTPAPAALVRPDGVEFPTREEFEIEEPDIAPSVGEDDYLRGCVDELVVQIEDFLLERPGQPWAFAAGPRLHNPVLERVRPSVRGSLVESVRANLALTPASELLEHFKVCA